MSAAAPTRPVLRYHGGKFRLAPWIIGHFPEHRVYVEPYGGAASVLLRKPRVNGECLGDLDGEIINVFRVLRDPASARELERLLHLTPYARGEYEAAYLLSGDPIEQARRSLIKSFMGFGADGLTATWTTGFRDNLTRGNGIPARDWSNLTPAVVTWCERLRGVVIEQRPALDLIRKHDSAGTLFFLDPPYPHSTRNGGTKHSYRFEMTDADHRELAAALRELKGRAVLSGYPCPLYDEELYADWRRVERRAFADGANERTEVLWFNFATPQRGLDFEECAP
jgi:DNA adenine methylase